MSIYIFFSAELWNTFPLILNWDAFHISNQTVAHNPRYFILLPEGCVTAKLQIICWFLATDTEAHLLTSPLILLFWVTIYKSILLKYDFWIFHHSWKHQSSLETGFGFTQHHNCNHVWVPSCPLRMPGCPSQDFSTFYWRCVLSAGFSLGS